MAQIRRKRRFSDRRPVPEERDFDRRKVEKAVRGVCVWVDFGVVWGRLAVYRPKIRLTAVSGSSRPFTICLTVKPVLYRLLTCFAHSNS